MINFNNASFLKSSATLKDAPKGRKKEILIVGRSNAGKSSLINALTNRKNLAYTSSKPGHTRLLNYYDIDNNFYLVDAPGYGYAKGGIDLDKLFYEIMDTYLNNNLYLKGALLLLDSRREFNENDDEMIEFFLSKKIPFVIILTKADKITQKEKSSAIKYMKDCKINEDDYLFSSTSNQMLLNKIKSKIESLLNK